MNKKLVYFAIGLLGMALVLVAQVAISGLTALGSFQTGDLFEVVDVNAVAPKSRKATIDQVVTYVEATAALQNLQGAVTDGQVPNNITIDLATTATTANAGDSATAFFASGEIEDARVVDALTIAGGTIGTSALTLVQGVAPTPTAEGVIEWETDDDHIIVGDGVASVEFVPAEDVSGDATMTDDGVVTLAAGITRDTEWDTESEVETAWSGANIIVATEIDTSAEVAGIVGDETGSGALVFATSPAFVGTPRIGNGTTSAGVLQIDEDDDDGANFASFTVPALAANTVYTLPPDDGDAGEQLQTDGAGVLTWEAAGAAGGGFTVVPLTADRSTTSATLVDITDLSFAVSANTAYVVRWYFRVNQTSSGVDGWAVDIPTGTISGGVMAISSHRIISADDTATASVMTSADSPVNGFAKVDVGVTGGTVQLRFKSNGSATVTVYEDSWLEWKEL